MSTSYLDLNGLGYLWGKAKDKFASKDISATDIEAVGISKVENEGNPVVISDVPYEQEANDVIVEFEPIQDLHGYDHPWPEGGGKNILPYPYTGKTKQSNGITYTINSDGSIHCEGSTSTTTSYYWCFGSTTEEIPDWIKPSTTYCVSSNNGSFSIGSINLQMIFYGTSQFVITESVATTLSDLSVYTGFAVVVRVAGNSTVNETIYPMIEIGSTPSAYSPYSNICPISGRTGVKVYADPVYGGMINWNQLNALNSTNDNSVINADNTVTVFSEAHTSNKYGHVSILQDRPFDSNHVHMIYTPGYFNDMGVRFYSALGSNYAIQSGREARFYKGLSNTETFVRALIPANESVVSVTTTVMLFDLTEMFGEETANYVYSLETERTGSGLAWFKNLFPKNWYPYSDGEETCVSDVNGEPYQYYSITFPSEAGTVYGGTLDVKTGVLTVTMASITLAGGNEATYTYNGVTSVASKAFVKDFGKAYGKTNYKSDIFKVGGGNYAFESLGRDNLNGIEFSLPPSVPQTTTDIKEWFENNPTQIVYELATPITYQLTPHQLTLLKKYNVITSDASNIRITYDGKSDSTIQSEIDELNETIFMIKQSISNSQIDNMFDTLDE